MDVNPPRLLALEHLTVGSDLKFKAKLGIHEVLQLFEDGLHLSTQLSHLILEPGILIIELTLLVGELALQVVQLLIQHGVLQHTQQLS
jgi:hypothetical protein